MNRKRLKWIINGLLQRNWPTKTTVAADTSSPPAGALIFLRRNPRLTICLSGKAVYRISGENGPRRITLMPGECIYIDAKCWIEPLRFEGAHILTMTTNPGGYPGRKKSGNSVRFVSERLDDIFFQKKSESFMTYIVKDEPGMHFQYFFNLIKQNIRQEEDERARLHLISLSLIEAGKNCNRIEEPEIDESSEKMEKAREFVMENYHLPISRDDVAKHVGVHPNSLSPMFQKMVGLSFKNFLTVLRLEQAHSFLRDKSLRIQDITGLCGFTGTPHFIRIFQQHFGISPLQMRKHYESAEKTQLAAEFEINRFSDFMELRCMSPEYEGKIKSLVEDKALITVFINARAETVELFWLDYEGARFSYGNILPGESRRLTSNETHPWLVADTSGKAIGIYVVGNEPSVAIID